MKRKLHCLFIFLVLSAVVGLSRTLDSSLQSIGITQSITQDTLCTPNPSKEAVALFRFLHDMYGKKILSGQMWVPWGINEIDYVKTNTGKYPAIAGFDYIHQSSNTTENQRAIKYWQDGGIPTIMWHWGAPARGEGYDYSKATIDIDSCFITGTKHYTDFWAELKKKADLLEKLKIANVPVLWRPFHELDGGWFWWSKEGPEKFKLLWRTMYDYFVKERKLNNLIWVLCYSGELKSNWYPGKEYVDIAGPDNYDTDTGSHIVMFNKANTAIEGNNHMKCFHELGLPFKPDECYTDGAMWSWWMIWHTSWLEGIDKEYLNTVFNHELVLTRDELPDIKSVYSWDSTCKPTKIVPYIMIDGGTLQQSDKIGKFSSSTAILSPQAVGTGKWKWNEFPATDTLREQSITVSDYHTYTVSFLNECGATSTETFDVYNDCVPTPIKPKAKIDNEDWIDTARVVLNIGSSLILSPQAGNEGSWSWTGCEFTDLTREQTFTPSVSCNSIVYYTNSCGKTSKLNYWIIVRKTSVSNLSNIGSMSIFPLPASETLNIQINEQKNSSPASIRIYTLQGMLVKETITTTNEISIDISQLRTGVYLLKVLQNNREISSKFTKIE